MTLDIIYWILEKLEAYKHKNVYCYIHPFAFQTRFSSVHKNGILLNQMIISTTTYSYIFVFHQTPFYWYLKRNLRCIKERCIYRVLIEPEDTCILLFCERSKTTFTKESKKFSLKVFFFLHNLSYNVYLQWYN